MTPEQKALILDRASGETDDAAFCSACGITAADFPEQVARLIEDAAVSRDDEALELALWLGARFGLPKSTIPSMHRLMVELWHTSHGEMVRLLQRWRDPASVAPLQEVIHLKPRLGYLDYDDYGALYKKCLCALAAIGTPEAVCAIEQCAASGDPVLREQAIDRLSKL